MNTNRNKILHIATVVKNFKKYNRFNNNNVHSKNLFHSINSKKNRRAHKLIEGNLALEELSKSVNNDLSQSVFDLVNCFICLSPAEDPFSCPKCKNFGCRKCLETYFGKAKKKPCPVCKQNITFIRLEKNNDIEKIEEILNKNDTKKNKYIELSHLILRNKMKIKKQFIKSNNILERLLKYQNNLKKYKEEFDYFLLQISQIIDKIFQNYNQQIENLINFFLSFDEISKSSITKYNDYNIKSLINEILSLERMKLNYNNHDSEKILNTSIKIVPSIYLYHMKETFLLIKDIKQNNYQKFSENNFQIVGDYMLSYTFEPKDMKCYCRLMFTLKDDTHKMCFMITQILLVNDKKLVIPMKFVRQDNKTYSYECKIASDEMKHCDKIQLNTDIVVFSI